MDQAVALDRVDVAQTDLLQADADVLVIPSTSVGTFGEPWLGMVARLAGISRVEEIELGGLRTVPISAGRHALLAFAATRSEDQDADERIVESIGRALAMLARDTPSLEVIASPVLGTGAGRLALELSVPALVRGFLAEPCEARLMLVAQDASIIRQIDGALRRAYAGPQGESVVPDPSMSKSAPPPLSPEVPVTPPPTTTGNDRMFASSIADTVPLPGGGRVRAADRLGGHRRRDARLGDPRPEHEPAPGDRTVR